jgi:hypothetical protein
MRDYDWDEPDVGGLSRNRQMFSSHAPIAMLA